MENNPITTYLELVLLYFYIKKNEINNFTDIYDIK